MCEQITCLTDLWARVPRAAFYFRVLFSKRQLLHSVPKRQFQPLPECQKLHVADAEADFKSTDLFALVSGRKERGSEYDGE